jgi:zinc transporter ZupT
VTGGIAFLVGIEGVVRAMGSDAVASFARMTLIADFIHHLVDGVILAGAFTAGLPTGLLALVAIGLHEVPREMGSAGVLVAAGYPPRRAFVLSVAMASAVPLGALTLYAWSGSADVAPVLSAFAAGTILHVALADILPFVWVRARAERRFSPAIGVGTGILFMLVAAGIEHH